MPTQPPKMSERFRAARRLIASAKADYICHALRESGLDVAGRARRLIHRRLGGHFTYGQWLMAEHPTAHERLCKDIKSARAARLCWLDALIAEFEAKGD